MAFGAFKSLQEVATTYRISLVVEVFLQPSPMPVDERFQKELLYTMAHVDVKMSEAAIGEFLVAPVLKEIWKSYSDSLLLWSHVSLSVGEEFTGVPDYLFTKRSALGLVREKPYLLVVEAKKDDFDAGWGQCLAALLAAQQLNGDERQTLYGVVSNGDLWQFGKLLGSRFIRDLRSVTITDLPALFAALNYLFGQAKQQALAA
jgi:hypothetical protein